MGNLLFFLSLLGPVNVAHAPEVIEETHGTVAIGKSYQDMVNVLGIPAGQVELKKEMQYLFKGKSCMFERVPCLVYTDKAGKITRMKEINPKYLEVKS